MATNHTDLLKLNQYIGTDKVKRVEFNDDNKKIDDFFKTQIKSIEIKDQNLIITKYNDESLNLKIVDDMDENIKGVITKKRLIEIIIDEAPKPKQATIENAGIISEKRIKEIISSVFVYATDEEILKGVING